MAEGADPKFLHDNFIEWCGNQPVPVIEEFGIDTMRLETAPWDHFGMNGAICLLKGRDDFTSLFTFEIPPGGNSERIHHLYEDVIYVLAGHGSTVVETPGSGQHSFEWGAHSLFSIPLNAVHQHFNGSGREPARFVAFHNLPYVMNLYRNEAFIFDNPAEFPERHGRQGYFSGDGELVMLRPGRHQWETNFVADICHFELHAWEARGVGSSSIRWILSDGTLGCHTSEIVSGTYKKGHRHFGGTNVLTITGQGYSLLWCEGESDTVRIDWDHGMVVTPPDQMFHQHFNTGEVPSRYLAVQIGTVRYPLTQAKRDIWAGQVDTSVKDGGAQIEYQDQDPRIHAMWLVEMDRNGIASQMGEIFDEDGIRSTDTGEST